MKYLQILKKDSLNKWETIKFIGQAVLKLI